MRPQVPEFGEVARLCARRYAEARHLYFIEDWNGYVVVLKFYGDESFTSKQSGFQGCYAVAGYVTSAGCWKNIADDWQDVLNIEPQIDYFHMSECYSVIEGMDKERYPPGQFAGMSKDQAKDRLYSMVKVLECHGPSMAALQSIITWDSFEYALNDADKVLFGSPYTLCVMGVIDGCRQALRDLNAESPVEFVFDERRDVSETIHSSWNITKKLASPDEAAVMGKIGFEEDKKCNPLQCADLLAWHARRQFIQPVEDHGKPRPEHERLKSRINRWYSHVWNEANLRERREQSWRAVRTQPNL